MENETYVFVCMQQANLETRSMLIPCTRLDVDVKEMLLSYKERFAETLEIRDAYGKVDIVDAVLIDMVPHPSGVGVTANPAENERNGLYYELWQLCEGEVSYFFPLTGLGILKHQDWYGFAHVNFCRGFNHVQNYKHVLARRHDIVESILFLEKREKEETDEGTCPITINGVDVISLIPSPPNQVLQR